MIADHYPPMSDCERYGMSGRCGLDCPALEDGECPTEQDFIEGWRLTCRKDIGMPQLELGAEYIVDERPSGKFVVVNGEEFFAERFWIEPIFKEEQS